MNTLGPKFSTILHINIRLIMATLLTIVSLVLWHNITPEWWAFGLLSICCGLAAFAAFVKSIREIIRMVLRDRELVKYQKQGTAPKSDTLASRDALRKEGITR
jgi:hypothetical protein